MRHLRERGVDGDDDERERSPDDERRDHRVLGERRLVPVVLKVVSDVQLREDVVEDPVLGVRHPGPDLDRDDLRHGPDEHEPDRQKQPHPCRNANEQQRDQRPAHDRQPDVDDREDDRTQERVPEHAVVEHEPEVVQADPLALVPDQLEQPVVLEREPDEVVERVSQHRRDHRGCGEEEHVRGGATPEAPS